MAMATPPSVEQQFVGLLNLPIHSHISLDGHPLILQTDDFVGFTNVPLEGFHFVAVRAALPIRPTTNAGCMATTVGFVLHRDFVRSYDPLTEEMGSADPNTAQNLVFLLANTHRPSIAPHRLLAWHNVVPATTRTTGGWWHNLVSHMSFDVLQERKIPPGTKIVPGSYRGEEEDDWEIDAIHRTARPDDADSPDGIAVDYPPIPVRHHQQHPHWTRHGGTKRFLARLSASQRTALALDHHPNALWDVVLSHYYHQSHDLLLGDWQLAFVLFVQLQCYPSFVHWRDLLALMASSSSHDCVTHKGFFLSLLTTLQTQMDHFSDWEDWDSDSFLIPVLQQLVQSAMSEPTLQRQGTQLQQTLVRRLPQHFDVGRLDEGISTTVDMLQDEEDHDANPVIVSAEEYDAGMQRILAATTNDPTHRNVDYPAELQREFPILFAACMSKEDVVMTCARALDSANDVSLVREAAAYLERYEQQRRE